MKAPRRRRGGWSLIELVVAVSALSVLLMAAGGLVFRMLSIDKAERSKAAAASALDRLARDLRDDARASAGPAEVADARLVLTMGGGRRAEYAIRGGRDSDVVRTVRLGDRAEHREIYRRPPGTVARFETGRDGPRTVVALVVSADPGSDTGKPADAAYRDFRIEAVPGRDARLGGRVAP